LWLMALQSPYPYYGGKSSVTSDVWQRFGKVDLYNEPFFGSGAMLLGRPGWPDNTTEIVNDLWGFVPNFWRAIKADPEAVAMHADIPIYEVQQHAVHAMLTGQRSQLAARLEGDINYYDAKTAGQWVWLMAMWIGHGVLSGRGPWSVELDEEGYKVLVRNAKKDIEDGISRALPEMHSDRGVRSNIERKRMQSTPVGVRSNVNRKRMQMHEHGVVRPVDLYDWFQALSDRFRDVYVLCGDWSRAVTPSVTTYHGTVGMFLDPPYSDSERRGDLYGEDSFTVANDVRKWCIENGDNKQMRIALCGYSGEHDELEDLGWERFEWKAVGGYGNQAKKGSKATGKANAAREVIWFSPHCLKETHHQPGMLDL